MHHSRSPVFLATNHLFVTSPLRSPLKIRALIDPGSELSFISEKVVLQLHLAGIFSKLPILGIGGTPSGCTRGLVRANLPLIYSSSAITSISRHVMTHLTAWLPFTQFNDLTWPILKTINLADPNFFSPGLIDMIIGADHYSQIIRSRIIRHHQSNLIPHETSFGWVIIGPLPSSNHVSLSLSVHQTTLSEMHDLLAKLWHPSY